MDKRPKGRLCRSWRGLTVDDDLTDGILERMNAVPGVQIRGTCGGHPRYEGGARTAWINFTVADMKGADYGDTDAERHAFDTRARKTFGDIAEVEMIGTGAEEHKLAVSLSSRVPRTRLSDSEAAAWWEAVVDRLEGFVKTVVPGRSCVIIKTPPSVQDRRARARGSPCQLSDPLDVGRP